MNFVTTGHNLGDLVGTAMIALDSPANYVNVVGNEIHVSTDSGVVVLDAAALPEAVVIDEYNTPGDARLIQAAGDRLVIGDGYGGLVVMERAE